MAMHAVIQFLEDKESLKGVDREFRKLVEQFHQIPFCATFGVSCAGHFYETGPDDEITPDSFYPIPHGMLDIIVDPEASNIPPLAALIQQVVARHADCTFKPVKHVFGPPKASRLKVWEIRIGDNGSLDGLGEHYCGGYKPIAGNREAYSRNRQRGLEIRLFWKDLEHAIGEYCQKNGFADFDLEKRIDEFRALWNPEQPISAE